MAKKKVNPNRKPLAKRDIDPRQIALDTTNSMVLKGWLLALGAFADFSEATTEGIVHLWEEVNRFSSSIRSYEDVEEQLKEIEARAGIPAPYDHISSADIRTEGDLKRFRKKIERKALYSAFALIAEPIIREELLDKDDIPKLFQKAFSLEAEIYQGRITMEEIRNDVLKEEFNIHVYETPSGQVRLCEGEPEGAEKSPETTQTADESSKEEAPPVR